MRKIYFIGRIPPPLGGVTIFNQRKLELLRKQLGEKQVVLIQPAYFHALLLLSSFLSSDEKHVSASNFLLIVLIVLFARKGTIIFYDHNSSRHLLSLPVWKRKVYECFFLKCAKIVVVNEHLKKNYQILTNYSALSYKFKEESAFLPPSIVELGEILSTYDSYLVDVYKRLENEGRKIVLTSAFQPNLDNNGNDIYTIELLIDVFVRLCDKYQEYYFIIAIANYPERDFSQKIKRKVNSLKGWRDNLIFIENDRKIWPLLKSTRLFIRATTTDGDSVSLREALYFNAPVLASDVVPRPNGVMLFNLENDNLEYKIDKCLSELI